MATMELQNYSERDGKDVYDDGVLTLDACACLVRTENVEDGGNVSAKFRPWVEENGRRGPLRQPRADSLGVEVQHGEAVKMVSSICSGAAGVGGDHDDGGGGR